MWTAIAMTMMAMTVVTGCSSDSQESAPTSQPSDLKLTRAEQEMVNQSNEFAFNLFREAQDRAKSQVLSPLSITFALGMLNNGAGGETLAQINNVLGFADTGADGINDFCYKMMKMASTLDPLTKVMIANNIYISKDHELQTDFVQKAKYFYNAKPETCDFHDGKTMDVINRWASDHTEKMIEKILDEDSFNPEYVSYLLNAIYFKGSWSKKFDKDQTVRQAFYPGGDRPDWIDVDMMHQVAEFGYYAEADYGKALRLPYGNGSFQMTVLLPNIETEEIKPKVPTAEEWQQLNNKMVSTLVDVKLPRFETDTDIDLKPIMMRLGMPDAFDEAYADFRYFCDSPVYIDLMKQVAKIKVDEEGTEAAAVTVVGFTNSVGPAVTFHADRPFLYVISEKQTGAIFFIGQYTGN